MCRNWHKQVADEEQVPNNQKLNLANIRYMAGILQLFGTRPEGVGDSPLSGNQLHILFAGRLNTNGYSCE